MKEAYVADARREGDMLEKLVETIPSKSHSVENVTGTVMPSGSWSLFSRLYKDYLAHHFPLLLISLLCMIAVAVASSTQTYLMGPLIDKALLAADRNRLWFIAAAILTIFVVRSLARYGQEVLLVTVGQKIVASIQGRLIDKIVHDDLDIVTISNPGELAALFTYDSNATRLAVCDVFLVAGKDTLTIVSMIGLMFYTNWRLALMCIVAPILAFIPMRILGREVRKISTSIQAMVGELTRSLVEVFQGIKTVKAYTIEEQEKRRIGNQMAKLAGLVVKGAWVGGAILPVVDGIGGMAVASVVIIGGAQVISRVVTPGQLFVLVSAIVGAYASVPSLSKVNVTLQTGLAAAQRLYTFLDRRPKLYVPPDAAALPVVPAAIRFDEVDFTYGGDIKILDKLNFVAAEGQVTAIVGESGAGKSTILNLIVRLYDPSAGTVRFSDHDLRTVQPDSLRRVVAFVAQETIIFDDTILNNIRLGRMTATDDEVEAVANLVGVSKFCSSMQGGLSTHVGERGLRLSGGQRQLIGIARALLRDAPILLLDEPTSLQDAQSEQEVQAALRHVMTGRTVIVVAHRLSTVRDANIIHVLEDGRIVESGGHDDLVNRAGAFARLSGFQVGAGGIAEAARTPHYIAPAEGV